MYRENEEVDDGTKFVYTWYRNNEKIANASSKALKTTIGNLRDAEFYFEAERK
jgi:hypothetical protein